MASFDHIEPAKGKRSLFRQLESLAASSAYTGASFLASLGPIILIGRIIDVDTRAAFFLFLAIFSPLTTVLAQKHLLAIYQGKAGGRLGLLLEEAALFMVAIALVFTGTQHQFSFTESLVLTSTVFTHIYAVTATGAVQHGTGNKSFWAGWAVAMAGVRIAVTWLALPYGPVVAFAAGSYAYMIASRTLKFIALRHHARTTGESAEEGRSDPWRDRVATLLFIVISALTFQVDKYVLNGVGMPEAVANSGAITMLMLSPISMVFATIYRQRTRALFDPDKHPRAKLPVIGRIAGQFLGIIAVYFALLALTWQGPVLLAFPFLSEPFGIGAILGVAILIDRMGTLFVFAAQSAFLNMVTVCYKTCVLAGILLASRSLASEDLLFSLYAFYALGSVGYVFLMAVLVFRKANHAPVR